MPMFKLNGKHYAYERQKGKTIVYELVLKPTDNITPEMIEIILETEVSLKNNSRK